MTDKELLELAAKSNWRQELADDEVMLRYSEPNDGVLYLHGDNQDHNGHDREFVWNPLTDDGDALRLAVKLGLDINSYHKNNETSACLYSNGIHHRCIERIDDDPYAATRRVIVRVAAEIAATPKP